MNDKFFMGLTLGMLGGAVIVANSIKARQIVKEGQEKVKQKVSKMTDKKDD